jgi:hypothetical protein
MNLAEHDLYRAGLLLGAPHVCVVALSTDALCTSVKPDETWERCPPSWKVVGSD